MNTVNIDLTFDQADKVTVETIKEIIAASLENPWPMYHSYTKSWNDVEAFLRVVEYFSTKSEFDDYLLTIQTERSDLASKALTEIYKGLGV